MAASSSSPSTSSGHLCKVRNRDEVQPVLDNVKRLKTLPSELPVSRHDIFLSHSGKQKGFVKDLYDQLNHLGFNTFFDLTHHSLPLAQNFPKRIFSAVEHCKLGVVVLSEDFVSSKWPMKELSAFVEAGVRILPLFFKLSPADLKDDTNLKKWGKIWEDFSAQDTRIKLTEWRHAIKEICSQNGLTFNGEAVEGEKTYLDRVVSGICENVPLAIKFDGAHLPGMNRLCQVVLDSFEEMESPGKVSVVGLYGLPGSGKSTLCKCLSHHFFPTYGRRSLHLELPTNPSTADLVREFKKLLDLTDFQGRHNLDRVSELQQLFNLLESYQLPRCRVFLVIDNISDQSWEALRMFLPLGLGPGSKVILVARTFNILQPAFLVLEQYGQHYIWNKMQIPSIQEIEAMQILLQTSGRQAVQHTNYLTPTQRETIVRIVRMCNFGSKDYPEYLPLVMKTMGAMLIYYDGNLVRWGSDLQNFWGKVKSYKDRAVKELVGKSFEALPDEELQLLFLDLSLFILPLNLESLQEVYVLLSNIYDGRSVADIELMIQDLEKHCFLTTSTIWSNTFRVHDLYLEFAKSISEDPSRFNSSIRYCWRNDKHTRAKDEKDVLSLKEVDQGTGIYKHQQVRAMILEVQGDGYKRVELQGFSNLKALAVRNCKALVVLGLVGLSSLASLDILDSPNLRHINIDGSNPSNVKRLRIFNDPEGHAGQAGDIKGGKTFLGEAVLDLAQKFFKTWWRTPQRSSLEMGVAAKMRGLHDLTLENTGIRRLMSMSSCWPQLQSLTVKEYYLEAFEVGNLPNLKCFNFWDNSVYNYAEYKGYPEYEDDYGYANYAKEYLKYGNYYESGDEYRGTQTWESKKDNPRFMLQGKGLLEGCPQLEQVEILSAFIEKGELGTLPPNMVSFELGYFYPARMLPDLSPAAHTLEKVCLVWCEKLEKISFLVEFGKLTILEVGACHSLVELTGLGFLCSLRSLEVRHCSNLRAILGPFDNLKMLECFEVDNCPKLTCLAGAGFENLVSIERLRFPLKRGECRHGRLNVKNLQKLEKLRVTWTWGQIIDDENDCSTSTMMQQQQQQLGGMLEGLENLVNLEELRLEGTPISSNQEQSIKAALVNMSFSSLVGLDEQYHAQTQLAAGLQRPSTTSLHLSSTTTGYKCQLNIESLHLENLSELASMDGLEQLYLPKLKELHLNYLENLRSLQGQLYLPKLKKLQLNYLENLRSLQGLGSLVQLELLWVRYCPMLEELPPLHTLVNLKQVWIGRCSKLKAVEGADAIVKSGLLHATFQECESLEHLPISVDTLRWYEGSRNIMHADFGLEFKDCRFASEKAMMAWAVNDEMPWSLRRVSLQHLLCDMIDDVDSSSDLVDVLFDAIFPYVLNIIFPNNDNTFINFNSQWIELEKVGGVAKKDLLQKFQAHPECKLPMLRSFNQNFSPHSKYEHVFQI